MQVEQRRDPLAGMGGAGPDPAGLLRLLLTYGRLEQAAALAVSYLDHWDKQARAEAVREGDGGAAFSVIPLLAPELFFQTALIRAS